MLGSTDSCFFYQDHLRSINYLSGHILLHFFAGFKLKVAPRAKVVFIKVDALETLFSGSIVQKSSPKIIPPMRKFNLFKSG